MPPTPRTPGLRTPGPRTLGPRLAGLAAAALAGLVLVTGCASTGSSTAHHGAAAKAPIASPSATPQPAATVSAPKDGATGVATSTELTVRTDRVSAPVVRLADARGKAVPGALRVDGSSWVPDGQLDYGAKYTATVTATDSAGKPVTSTSTFTTMKQPGDTVSAHTYTADGQVLGVAAPLVVTFDKPIPKDKRDDVERRLFVTATPAQPGSWYWFSSTEVHYRPKEYWQTGTHISLRAAIGGLSLGNGEYLRSDLSVDATVVDQALAINIDDTTKTLTVTRNGVVIKTMPASLGKDSTPSSSGHMVVMTRAKSEIFDSSTFGVPVDSPDGYKETVLFPLRLTWGGQYIHAAPWSVADQGKDNVSHGCTNISTDNAEWLYNETHVGDPVNVVHTSSDLTWGDGWSDWDKSWTSYQQGSALYNTSTDSTPDYTAPGAA